MIFIKFCIKSIVFTFLSVIILFSCENDIQKVNVIAEKQNIADYTAEGVVLSYSDSAKIILNITASEIKKFTYAEKPYTEFSAGIKVVHFEKYPDTASSIRANHAIKWDEEKYWEASGNVVAHNSKGETLNTEYLIWDEKEKTIHSDKPVTITTKEDIIFGEGFTSDQQFQNWKILKVKGFINVAQQN